MSERIFPSNPTMRAMAAGVQAGVPVLLWGKPGAGKSATIEGNFAKWGYHIETITASSRESVDFLGMPKETDNGVEYVPFKWAQRAAAAKKAVVFFDELTTGGISAERGMLRVIQEGWVGELKLPDTVRFIAAANPPDVAVGGEELAPPTANRFMHLDWHFDADHWRTGMVAGFDNVAVPSLESMTAGGSVEDRAHAFALVVAFTQHRPDLLEPAVPTGEAAGRAYPTPRAWTNVARVLTFVHRDDTSTQLLVLSGLVGNGAAREFITWVASAGLYDVVAVMNDPSIVTWTKDRPDTLYALLQAVVSTAIGHGDKATYEKAFAVCESAAVAGRKDVMIPALMELGSRKPSDAAIPASLHPALSDVLIAPRVALRSA